MGVFSNFQQAGPNGSREAEKRASRSLISVLISLSLALTGFFPLPANAIGTGPCEQSISDETGVTVVQSGNYCYIAFTYVSEADGVQNTTWNNPSGINTVDVLVVGGGGGGGSRHGGGGGAGGVMEFTNHPIPIAGINVGVGKGGAGAPGGSTSFIGSKGFDSQFAGIRALGGGAGVNGTSSLVNGGSGGGAGWNQTPGQPQAQSQSTLTGTNLGSFTGGFAGAAGANESDSNDYWAGGGGGGAGGAGANPSVNGTTFTTFTSGLGPVARGGAGGVGKTVTWITPALATALGVGHVSGGSAYFGGGGGGGIGADGQAGGTGGLGGGANGTKADSVGNNGSAHTGGGGGGSGFDDIGPYAANTVQNPEGGDGGSGAIIIRYQFVPNAPTSLVNSEISSSSVKVSFTAPSYVPGGPLYTAGVISSYQYSLNGGTSWFTASQTVSPLVITGLTPETTYNNVRIRAVNQHGPGDAANVASFSTLRDPNSYLRLNYNSTDVDSYDPAGSNSLAVRNLGSLNTLSATISNQSNGAISLNSSTRAWSFPGGSNSTGSFIDVGDFSYAPFRSGGITVDFEADFGTANNWERLFDFGEMRTSTVGEVNNFFVSRHFTNNDLLVAIWDNGSVISECRTNDGSLTSGMARWTIRLDGTLCTIWKNGSQRTVARENGSSAGTSISFGVMPNVTVTNNFIGKSNWTADAQFEGQIRSIRFYQGGFNPSEIPTVSYNVVQFNRAGGNADPASLSTSGKIRVPSLGSVTRVGYTLAGWTNGTTTFSPGAIYTAPVGTSSLSATWNPNSNTVSWDVNGGTVIANSFFLTAGTLQQPTDPTKSSVVFGGWSTTETSNNGDLANRIESWPYNPNTTSAITLSAIWLNPCTTTTTTFVGTGTTNSALATFGVVGKTYTQVRINTTGNCGWVVPEGVSAADIMIVGGGGAGSYYGLAGGGGAGAVLVSKQPVSLSPGSQHLVQVGAGGTYTLVSQTGVGNTGTKGSQSRFSEFIAAGGGFGAGGNSPIPAATSGGSGGGAAACTQRTGASAGANPNHSIFDYFANAGASASSTGDCQGNGGGGGGAGGAATDHNGGNSLTRFGIEVAGGGSAFQGSGTGGGTVGGTYVDSCVAPTTNQATRAGKPNTGSGGSSCGSGGSGTIVLRYSAEYQITIAPGASGSGTALTYTKSQAAALVLPNTTSANAAFTRSGFSVVGFSTTDGGSRTHNLGGTFSTDANTTLYPVWAANNFNITFRAGAGASGSDQVIVKQPSQSATLLAASLGNLYFTKANSRVTGWTTTDGGPHVFDLGATYVTDSDVVLFPVWSSLCSPNRVGRYIDGQPYWVLDFTTVGSCAWEIPSGLSTIESMIVAAGGGGGAAFDSGGAGGGGGGQVKFSGGLDVSGLPQVTIRVGAGGTGGPGTSTGPREDHGSRGGNSELFVTIVNKFLSLGGDGGARSRGDYLVSARTGGIGGAAATVSAGAQGGSFGGGGNTGGGGGGAGGPGGTSAGIARGVAGLGITSSISGISQTFGTGGAGGVGNSPQTVTPQANSGVGGRGAGSNGSSQANGSNGGSGRVIVRYLANVSTDSSLATMTFSTGIVSPSFVPSTKNYTLTVTRNNTFFTLSPTVNEFGARIRVNGTLLDPTSTSVTVSSPVGVSVVTVHVTAPNGVDSTSYTITVSRQGPTLHTAADFLGTSVSWATNTYFDSYASQSGVLDSDAPDTNNLVWQLYYAHTELRIPADGVSRFGINTYAGGVNPWNWYFAASTTPNTLGSFSNPVTVSQQATNYYYSPGEFIEGTATREVTVPANTYFLIGVEDGPYYRSIKKSPSRTANVSGSNIVTSMNTVFAAPQTRGAIRGVPVALGGSLANYVYSGTPGVEYVQYDGYQSVISIKFRYLNDWSSNSALASVSISAGVLSPSFGSSTLTYSASVSPNVTSITVSATIANQFASLEINGTSVASGSSSNAISLAYGSNTISIDVEAQDGSTRSYTISVERPLPVYVVTYDKNGSDGAPERSTDSYTLSSSAIVLPLAGTMAKTGFTFGGWTSTQNNASTKINGDYTPSASITLYALWTAGQYTYTYNSNGATTGSPSASTGSYTTGGTAITLVGQGNLGKLGYSFNGWSTTQNDATTKVLNSGSLTISAPVIFYALWTAINYSVSYSVSDAVSGTAPTDNGNYNISESAAVKSNTGNLAKTGYSFNGWTTNSDGSGTVYQPGTSYVFGAQNVTFYPKFTPNTYIVTYNTNGATGTPAGGSTTSYTTGNAGLSLANVGTMVKTGYDFSGWSANPTGTAHSGAYTTTADVTLYAIWTLKDISVSYARGSIGATAMSSNEIATFPSNTSGKYNATITLSPTISNTILFGGNNYQFFGWNDGNSTFRSLDNFTLTEIAPTFTAQWVRLYAVRYALNGGTGIVTVDSECQGVDYTCLANDVITLSAAPNRDGYLFTGWEDQSNNSYQAGGTFTVTDTKYLLYAQWQAIDYAMTFDSAGGANSPASFSKTIGQSFAMPDPGSRTGYDFAGWSDGSVTYGIGVTYNVGVGDKNFVAVWTPRTYLITYNWNGGSRVSGAVISTFSYTVGTSAVALSNGATYARDGYVFDGWSLTDGGSKLTSPYAPTATQMLYARWLDGSYELSYNPRGGTVARARDFVSRSSAIALPTPIRAGFHFDGWFEDQAFTTRATLVSNQYTPDASKTLYAKWTQNSLAGVNPAHINTLATITITGAHSWSGDHALSGTGAALSVPSGALDAGVVLSVSFVDDLTRPRNLIDSSFAYYTSVLVHWLKGTGDNATVPDTAAGKPITLTLTNPNIKVGAKVFMIINGVATEIATATVAGQVTIQLTQDPEFVVAATKPDAPSIVAVTAGNTSASISWTVPGTGGSDIISYTVTASNSGGSCTTATLSCVVTGLVNGSTYSFTVTATNAIGTSGASSLSSVVTPALATYTVQFDSNGGSSIASSSFAQAGAISQPGTPTKQGFTFQGWSTVLNDASTVVTFPYSPSVYQNLTLYALWTAVVVAPTPGPSIPPVSTTSPEVPTIPTTPKPVVVEPTQNIIFTANTVRQVVLEGTRLNLVTSVTIDGKKVQILRKLPGKLVLKLPALKAGTYALDISYSGGKAQSREFLTIINEPANKVNVGSFNGKVVLYVKGFKGQRISAKIGDRWVVIPVSSGKFSRVVVKVGLGYELNVRLFNQRKQTEIVYLLTH